MPEVKNIPNYCSNDLVITARKKKDIPDLKKFKELAFTKDYYEKEENVKDRDNKLDFEKFVPYPKVVVEQKEDLKKIQAMKERGENTTKQEILHKLTYGNMEWNWHDWHCANWGTKWNSCYTEEPEEDGNKLIYRFDTAWSQPTPVIFEMSVLFPNLIFKLNYYEQGMGFQGVFQCKAGKVLKAQDKQYRGGRGG